MPCKSCHRRRHRNLHYDYLRFTSVCSTWSWVLMVCALAWYTRCAVIMLTSSAVRSTLDSSIAEDCSVPRLPEFGVPTKGAPESEVSAHSLLPSACKPFGLRKLAST